MDQQAQHIHAEETVLLINFSSVCYSSLYILSTHTSHCACVSDKLTDCFDISELMDFGKRDRNVQQSKICNSRCECPCAGTRWLCLGNLYLFVVVVCLFFCFGDLRAGYFGFGLCGWALVTFLLTGSISSAF